MLGGEDMAARSTSHPGWEEVAVKEAAWTSLIIQDNLNELGCIVVQQMVKARPGKNKR